MSSQTADLQVFDHAEKFFNLKNFKNLLNIPSLLLHQGSDIHYKIGF